MSDLSPQPAQTLERGDVGGHRWTSTQKPSVRSCLRGGSPLAAAAQMQSESERATAEQEREPPPKKSSVYVLLKVLFCVIKHPFVARHP